MLDHRTVSLGLLLLVGCEEPGIDAPGLYIAECSQCHGNVGQGTALGPDLAIVTSGMTSETLVEVILDGTDAMPAIELTEDEAAEVATFVLDDLLLR